MLRNPELRKLLLIAAPVCAVFTAVCLVLDTTAGILTGVLSVLLLSLYLLDVRRRYRTMARLAEDIDAVLKTLAPREEEVIRLRFGLRDGRCHTLEEVGSQFNVTRERIRQIEAKALRKLRHPVRSNKFKDK